MARAEPDEAQKALCFGRLPREYLAEWDITSDLDLVRRRLGVEVQEVLPEEVSARYRSLGEEQAAEADRLARELVSGAESRGREAASRGDELLRAARLYVAMRGMVDELGADAVTAVCRDFRGEAAAGFPAPCVPLVLFQERGVPAACQGDLDALLTMMLFRRATGWTSFMGGARAEHGAHPGRITVDHCALSRRMSRVDPPRPYYVAGYHGDFSGPTIHTDVQPGREVTLARLTGGLERLILAGGTVTGCSDREGRCRNTLEIELAEPGGLMREVRGIQYHLVVACGDHVQAMSELAAARGIEVLRV